MRTGPYNNNNNNKNRNRNRNRRPNTGSSGGQAGGSGANRVYDSNGPDVKLRGTAQTIAEKYMQLARDANSSGDRVAAESYYQFGDHYYRVWLAAQPVGQPIQFARRNAEDEYDEDGNELAPESDNNENDSSDNTEPVESAPIAEAAEPQVEGEGYQPRQNNNNRNYNNNNPNREGGNNRNNNRQRWPRRNDRYNQDGQANGNQAEGEQAERPERPIEEPVAVQREPEPVESSNWEAPSFLTRPVPVIADAPTEAATDAIPAPRRGRKPRVAAPVEDAPTGE